MLGLLWCFVCYYGFYAPRQLIVIAFKEAVCHRFTLFCYGLPCFVCCRFAFIPPLGPFFGGGEEEEPLACGYFIILYIDPLGFLLRLKSLVLLSIYDVEKPLSCGGQDKG